MSFYPEPKDAWSSAQQERLKSLLNPFVDCLLDENTRQNLIRVRDQQEVWEKHIADVWIPLVKKGIEIKGKVADIGSGNGIPGMVWSLLFPHAEFHLIESQIKKARFLKEAKARLGLEHVKVIHQRVEALGRPQSMNIVTARAVDHLRVVLEYAAPLLKTDGLALVFKGPNYFSEVAESRRCIHLLHYQLVDEIPYTLKWNQIFERVLLIYRKTKDTPNQYPRTIGKARLKPI